MIILNHNFLAAKFIWYSEYLTEYNIVTNCKFHSNLQAAFLESMQIPTIPP